MIRLAVQWRPEDQAWLLASQSRSGSLLSAYGWSVLAAGLFLAVLAPAAVRLAAWAVSNPFDPAPLLRPLAGAEAAGAGAVLGLSLLLALLLLWVEPFGLRGALETRLAEGREPLLGPVAVTLAPERASFRAAAWESSIDAALLTELQETAEHLVLRFGPSRPVILPRRDLTATETAAVRDWAAAVLGTPRRPAASPS